MSTAAPGPPPDLQPAPLAAASIASRIRHHLLVRDSVTFLILTVCTVVLFSLTLLLFRSFAAHQQRLAREWSERGRAEVAQGHPEEAVASLRAALTYAPGERGDELLLAQALGDAGHTEESYTYFTGLWDSTPGDGFINLRLARLCVTKGDRENAVNFYHAAIFGTWPGDAILRRQETRLELAGYLIAQKQFAPAREELLIAGSNAGHNPELDHRVSDLLANAADPREALDYALKALSDQPNNPGNVIAAAQLSDRLDDTAGALRLADRAIRLLDAAEPQTPATVASITAMRALRSELDRLRALDPSDSLPSAERSRRLLADAAIVRQRLTTCLATATLPAAASLTDLSTQWSALQPTLNPRTLARSHDDQDAVMRLIDTTEILSSQSCGATTGDDALLLRLARLHARAGNTVSGAALLPNQP